MEHSSLGPSWQRWAAIFVGAGALAMGACSSPNTTSWFGPVAPSTHASRAIPLVSRTFSWQPVTYKGTLNEVGGVNNEAQIVGVYRDSGKYRSFTAPCGRTVAKKYIDCGSLTTSSFTVLDYTGAAGTYLYANSTTDPLSYDAGFVTFTQLHTTSGLQCFTCGALYVENGSKPGWLPLLVDPSQVQSGPCAVTELLGINGAKVAVGFYETGAGTTESPCIKHAFEEYILNNNPNEPTFVDFNFPKTISSVAAGIDNGGNVVGYEAPNGTAAAEEGWYYHDNVYTPFYVNNSSANSTYPAGISWGGVVAGSYANSNVTHGFFVQLNNHQLTTGTGISYSTIDYGANTETVINGIAPAHDWLTGWYRSTTTSGNGQIQGLVGNCTSSC